MSVETARRSSTEVGTQPSTVTGNRRASTDSEARGYAIMNSPHSLMISPNLDALLEFEEQIRQVATLQCSPTQPWSPSRPTTSGEYVTYSPGFPIGLPPPPRGPRKPRSATRKEVRPDDRPTTTHSPIEISPSHNGGHIIHSPPLYSRLLSSTSPDTSTPNPYINPPPSLQDILLHAKMVGSDALKKPSAAARLGVASSSVKLGDEDGRTSSWMDGELSGTSQSTGDGRVTRNQRQQSRKQPRSPRLWEGKESLGPINDELSSPLPGLSPAMSGGKAQVSGERRKELVKIKADDNKEMARGFGTQNGDSTAAAPGQRPFLLSHVLNSPPGHTDSTYPTSTIDPQISISSTIYPSSTKLYSFNQPMDGPPPPSPSEAMRGRQSSTNYPNSDQQSFMDMFSSDGLEFSLNKVELRKKELKDAADSRSRSNSPQHLPLVGLGLVSRSEAKTAPSSRGASPASYNREPDGNDNDNIIAREGLPPTTNFLQFEERADLIRKARKLAQVFGQPPGAEILAQQETGRSVRAYGSGSIHGNGNQQSLRHIGEASSWAVRTGVLHINPSERRHSSPLTPDSFSFMANDQLSGESKLRNDGSNGAADGTSGGRRREVGRRASLISFIDLSDEEVIDRQQTAGTPRSSATRRPSSPSYQSVLENMTPEELAEEDRRKKREKLAKLHRYLGSRVPADLVLGIDLPPTELMLPPAAFDSAILGENEPSSRSAWIKRRRSSSVTTFSSWSDTLDRMKDDLNEKEKAINVRRAQKMERVFGIAPPQILYHTRQSPSPSATTPIGQMPGYTAIGDVMTTAIPNGRNPNRSAYRPKKKNDRPSTSESSKQLLPKSIPSGSCDVRRHPHNSLVYSHYQHSLNSLNDIIDRDDRESLAELHEYLNSNDISATPFAASKPPLEQTKNDRRSSTASSKSERRRSLPTRTSLISLSSEYNVSLTPKPEATDFQIRRRRAAKLTQFFGVDYRELIRDVLESIESGLEHERKRGTLNSDEVEDLLSRLRNLRTKRDGIF